MPTLEVMENQMEKNVENGMARDYVGLVGIWGERTYVWGMGLATRNHDKEPSFLEPDRAKLCKGLVYQGCRVAST